MKEKARVLVFENFRNSQTGNKKSFLVFKISNQMSLACLLMINMLNIRRSLLYGCDGPRH